MTNRNGWMKLQADRVANRLRNTRSPRAPAYTIETVRDVCDQSTAGDLDCIQLDILTDMVWSRLHATA